MVGLYGKRCSWPMAVRSSPTKLISANPFCSRDAKVVAGFQPVMPTFQGLITEEDVVRLIEYIKSFGDGTGSS